MCGIICEWASMNPMVEELTVAKVSCLFREICSPSTPQLTQATAVAIPSVLCTYGVFQQASLMLMLAVTFGFLLPGAVWLLASLTSQSTFRHAAAGAACLAGIGILAATLTAFIVATPATLEYVILHGAISEGRLAWIVQKCGK